MILKRLAESIRKQDWFVVFIEVMIVVVGIFIGLQVDDWNQTRKDRVDTLINMKRIQMDLDTDHKFYTFLLNESKLKNNALLSIEHMVSENIRPTEEPDKFFDLMDMSTTIGWEFPEVQTATFRELQSSGKLGLIDNAGLRKQLSFYYEESVHRSERIESRITGYAAMLYQIADPNIQIAHRRDEVRYNKQVINSEEFDKQSAVNSFLLAAKDEQFLRLMAAERHYTRFMTKLIMDQLEQTRLLQQAINEALIEIEY